MLRKVVCTMKQYTSFYINCTCQSSYASLRTLTSAKNMIDPLNQSPGQPQKVPGIRIKARPDIYMPVHCTGNFMRDKYTGEKQIKTNIIYLFLFVTFIEKSQASGSSPSLLRPIRK